MRVKFFSSFPSWLFQCHLYIFLFFLWNSPTHHPFRANFRLDSLTFGFCSHFVFSKFFIQKAQKCFRSKIYLRTLNFIYRRESFLSFNHRRYFYYLLNSFDFFDSFDFLNWIRSFLPPNQLYSINSLPVWMLVFWLISCECLWIWLNVSKIL